MRVDSPSHGDLVTTELGIGTPLISALALATLWAAEGIVPMFAHLRGRWHRRFHNLALGALNSIATSLVFAGLTFLGVEWARAHGIGLVRWIEMPTWVSWIIVLLAIDAAHYAFHVLAHRSPLLWRLHTVHHHDTQVDVTSAVRFHVGEIGIQASLMIGVYVVLGATMPQALVYHLILVPNAMFHHANVDIPERIDRWLRLVIVTPRMHWVHHSRWQPETDSNFSGVLSIWDRLFGTYRLRADPRTIDFGLDGFDPGHHSTLRGILATPFSTAHAGPGDPPRAIEWDAPTEALAETEAAHAFAPDASRAPIIAKAHVRTRRANPTRPESPAPLRD